jgi:hypothetical protein
VGPFFRTEYTAFRAPILDAWGNPSKSIALFSHALL